jgi:hypothetical protein
MKILFLLTLTILIITILTQQNNQTVNNNNNKPANQTISNAPNNNTKKPDDKEFNLTDSLIKFFNEMFGDDTNKTNKTDSEAKKKIEEQKRLEEEKRREEINKLKNMEKIRLENERLEKEKAKQKQMLMQLEKEREEFERQVENISISEFTNLYLEGKSGELLYHSVSKPCNLKIIFLLTDVQKTIHLTFNGPNGRGGTTLIRSFRSKNFLFYEHNAQIPGQYTFYLNNYHNSDETEVIFAINDDTKVEESLGKQKVDKISGYLNEIDLKINQMRSKQNIINKKTETHNDSVNKHNKEILIYSIIEVITMLIVFAVQTFYIKSIVEKL